MEEKDVVKVINEVFTQLDDVIKDVDNKSYRAMMKANLLGFKILIIQQNIPLEVLERQEVDLDVESLKIPEVEKTEPKEEKQVEVTETSTPLVKRAATAQHVFMTQSQYLPKELTSTTSKLSSSTSDHEPAFPREVEEAREEEVMEQVHIDEKSEEKVVAFPEQVSHRCEDTNGMIHLISEKKLAKPNGKQFSKEEIISLTHVQQHRNILNHYASLFESDASLEEITNDIMSRIKALENPESEQVITLEDGLTTFSVPWIQGFQTLCFDFRKEPDGTYSFVLHNRGEGIEDKEMHGNIRIKVGNRVIAKTSVIINCSSMDLPDFITELVTAYKESKSIRDVYGIIKNHLLSKGTIQITELEKEILEGGEDLRELTKRLRKEDRSYHAIQRNGTVNKSSLTDSENFLVIPELKKCLSLFSIIQQTSKYELEVISYLQKEMSRKGDPKILSNHTWRWEKEAKSISLAA